jgi:hypothetical protein
MTQDNNELLHQLVQSIAQSTQIGKLSGSDLAKLLAKLITQAIKLEREHTNKRLDHIQRQLNLLRSNDRARAARELRASTIADSDDD